MLLQGPGMDRMDAERTNERDTPEVWVAFWNVPALLLARMQRGRGRGGGQQRRLKRGGGAWQESILVRPTDGRTAGDETLSPSISATPIPPPRDPSNKMHGEVSPVSMTSLAPSPF